MINEKKETLFPIAALKVEEEMNWTNPLAEEEDEVEEDVRVVDEDSGVTDVTSSFAVVDVLLWNERVGVVEVSVL